MKKNNKSMKTNNSKKQIMMKIDVNDNNNENDDIGISRIVSKNKQNQNNSIKNNNVNVKGSSNNNKRDNNQISDHISEQDINQKKNNTKKKARRIRAKDHKEEENNQNDNDNDHDHDNSNVEHSNDDIVCTASNHNNNNNPLLKIHSEFIHNNITKNEYEHYFSNNDKLITTDRRAELWMKQYNIGEDSINQYSWAIPTLRAMHILKHFSPIIEIGCGTNAYWCQQMIQHNINVIGYDIHMNDGGIINNNASNKNNKKHVKQQQKGIMSNKKFQVQHGGPEVLKQSSNRNRTLFLCYPDEYDNNKDDNDEDNNDDDMTSNHMAYQCLQYYNGEYIIHVGELYSQSTPTLSMEQAPWGRTSSPEFQQLLSNQYHCLLRIALPNWLHTSDTLTVWKRSSTSIIVYESDTDDEDNNNNNNNNNNKIQKDKDDDNVDEVQFRYIPPNEKLPCDAVAPCLQHLYDQLPTDEPMLFHYDNDNVHNNNNKDDNELKLIHNKNKNSKKKNEIITKNENADIDKKTMYRMNLFENTSINSSSSEKNDNDDDDENKTNKKNKKKNNHSKKIKKQMNNSNDDNDNADYHCPW